MPILSITRDWGTSGPAIVRVDCSDSLATATASGYVKSQAKVLNRLTGGSWEWLPDDLIALGCIDQSQICNFTITNGIANFNTFIQISGVGGGSGVTPQQVQQSAFNFQAATGANDAFVVALSPEVTVLTDGLIVSMLSGTLRNLTTTPTLQINGLTPVPIVLGSGNLEAGDIAINGTYLFIYNASINKFQLLNPSVLNANTYSVQSNAYNAAADSGVANAYIVTLAPRAPAFTLGFPVYMQVGNTNTGASTLTIAGVTDDITLQDGSPLPAGALVSGQIAYLLFSSGSWKLINPVLAAAPTFTWSGISGTTQAASVNHGYVVQNAAQTTITLPATAALGAVVSVRGLGAAGWVLEANSGQVIHVGALASSTAGTVTSANNYDNIDVICIVANTTWSVNTTLSSGFTVS